MDIAPSHNEKDTLQDKKIATTAVTRIQKESQLCVSNEHVNLKLSIFTEPLI